MGGFLVFLFIVFCVYMVFKTSKAKKQQVQTSLEPSATPITAKPAEPQVAPDITPQASDITATSTGHYYDDDGYGDDSEIVTPRTCTIHYTNADGGFSIRDIEILEFWENDYGNLAISAYDLDIRELRTFRIDRIEMLIHDDVLYTGFDDIFQAIEDMFE